ncbi:TetR/AcrR family transcriptional regulator [Streptomyces sp. FXJ1.172]|uniref:TetR/AcrR family transcriptional regulator n=1 Tax=Streptomyces sp. FXJ1.172 TaxID=710705 RepID=UPI0007D026E1|nr:TetR/AcrR family transcriptional regulator [Streptomyces sp. FXJ1.172]WEO92849.1 TetR/AcrR family transcriptional regulator [Streptomyces sp. FXJ1.172]
MQTTDAPGRAPQRSDARANRQRILATARRKLRDDPDASLDSIAAAAGLARRTLYGHFSNRHALITELTQDAAQALRQAFAMTRIPGADPLEEMARMALAAWAVGDQYRMLISLGRRHLGEEAIRATLAPARQEAIAAIRRGQHEGVFANHVPPPVLAQTLEALMLALAEENTTSTWADPTGEAAATAFLVAAGVAPQTASLRVRAVLHDQVVAPIGTAASTR